MPSYFACSKCQPYISKKKAHTQCQFTASGGVARHLSLRCQVKDPLESAAASATETDLAMIPPSQKQILRTNGVAEPLFQVSHVCCMLSHLQYLQNISIPDKHISFQHLSAAHHRKSTRTCFPFAISLTSQVHETSPRLHHDISKTPPRLYQGFICKSCDPGRYPIR